MGMAMLKNSLKYWITGNNIHWLQNVRGSKSGKINRVYLILNQCIDKRFKLL